VEQGWSGVFNGGEGKSFGETKGDDEPLYILNFVGLGWILSVRISLNVRLSGHRGVSSVPLDSCLLVPKMAIIGYTVATELHHPTIHLTLRWIR